MIVQIHRSFLNKMDLNQSEFWFIFHTKVFLGEKLTLPSKRVLMKITGFKSEKIRKLIKSLLEKKVIIVRNDLTSEGVKNILCNKNLHGLGCGNLVCSWCNIKTMLLEEHHFPVPKSSGGEQTIDICPNCHSEYHAMLDYSIYMLNSEYLKQVFA